jgi:hypothetical protein
MQSLWRTNPVQRAGDENRWPCVSHQLFRVRRVRVPLRERPGIRAERKQVIL